MALKPRLSTIYIAHRSPFRKSLTFLEIHCFLHSPKSLATHLVSPCYTACSLSSRWWGVQQWLREPSPQHGHKKKWTWDLCSTSYTAWNPHGCGTDEKPRLSAPGCTLRRGAKGSLPVLCCSSGWMALMAAELVLEIVLKYLCQARTHCQYCVELQKKPKFLTERGNQLLQLEETNRRKTRKLWD